MSEQSDVAPDAPCLCGHAREAHEHYRRGSDCGVCGRDVCGKFRPAAGPAAPAEGAAEGASKGASGPAEDAGSA